MCAVFGLLDFKGKLTPAERLRIVKALGKAAEVRGTDATGIAYVQNGSIQIQKAPRPAHKMRWRVAPNARYIMGHTRMATQGSERFNFNNHPFAGKSGHLSFALAHNGVLYNDGTLRWTHKLPHTKIETDSYVAVQLLEREGNLSAHSFQRMAEALLGTFTITVLDARESLYFVKGNNPLEILLLPELGCYLYASTAEILNHALRELGMTDTTAVSVKIIPGDIMQIDRDGQRTVSRFDDSALWYDTGFSLWPYSAGSCSVRTAAKDINTDDAYWEDLKTVAAYYGYSSEMIDGLRHHGFQPEEVEEYLYEGGGVPCGYF